WGVDGLRAEGRLGLLNSQRDLGANRNRLCRRADWAHAAGALPRHHPLGRSDDRDGHGRRRRRPRAPFGLAPRLSTGHPCLGRRHYLHRVQSPAPQPGLGGDAHVHEGQAGRPARTHRMMARLKSVLRRVRGLVLRESPEIRAWRLRAEQLSARAVFNAGHADAELDQVTERQKRELYPRLRELLNGTERLALDLGCGTGRFSGDLAALISGRVIAVDPVQRLLDLAPAHRGVEYRRMKVGRIPAATGSIDLVWICLVLGGIR